MGTAGKIQPDKDEARAFIRRFCQEVLWLKQLHGVGQALFQDHIARHLMKQTANTFSCGRRWG